MTGYGYEDPRSIYSEWNRRKAGTRSPRGILSAIKRGMGHFGLDVVRKREPHLDYGLYQEYPVESLSQRRFYNVGSGMFYHPYWTNLDYASEHYESTQRHPFINYDLMQLAPLPIEDSSAEIVYSSHTIEHISDAAVSNLLKESYRVLRKGGCIRLTCPDMALFFSAYVRNDITFWYWRERYSRTGEWEHIYRMPLHRASIHQLFLCHFATQLSDISIDDSPLKKYTDAEIGEVFSSRSMTDAFEYFASRCAYNYEHPGNHINWWTHEKVTLFLRKAGFETCYRSSYGQSQFAPLRELNQFDKTHPRMSLYVEGIKEAER